MLGRRFRQCVLSLIATVNETGVLLTDMINC